MKYRYEFSRNDTTWGIDHHFVIEVTPDEARDPKTGQQIRQFIAAMREWWTSQPKEAPHA